MGSWTSKLTRMVADLGEGDSGYDGSEDLILEPPDKAELAALLLLAPVRTRSFLGQLFGDCGGVTLPDLHTGYFIDTAEKIRRRLVEKSPLEPRTLESDLGADVVCFGSDGGGGRFAFVAAADEGVWYLPVGGVFDGVFRNLQTPIVRVGRDASDFGDRLIADIEAFLDDKRGWKYLGE